MEKQKPVLTGLVRDNPQTREGKYLVKRRDGTVPEWPHFVLGGRDPHAAIAIRAYANSAMKDPKFERSMVLRLFDLADMFDQYRATHGSGDPHMGIHRIDDPVTVLEMRRGWSA